MKRLKNLILVVLVFFVGLGFTACKNDNSGNGGNQNQQKHSYTITYQDTKGLTNENPTTYTEDTETIILKDLKGTDDYEFLGWYNGETKVTEITKGSKGNLTLTARWKEIIRELAYKLSEDGTYYIVTGMGECNISDIVIPDTYNGLPVKEIGKSAFASDFTITSVVIGNNVTSIGEYAFNACFNLTSVTIGKNVKDIPDQLFSLSLYLVEVYNLSNLNIEKGSENYGWVGYYAEDIYTSLDEPSKLKTSNGMIYYVNDDEKIAMKPVDIFSPSVIIEEDCTKVEENAFFISREWLTEIYNLSSIDIRNEIGNKFYGYKEDLYIYTSLDEPSKLKTSNGMIYYVTDKEKIAIRPETIKVDWEHECLVFDKGEIVIDDDCTRIGKNAFTISNLTSITIPNSVTSIGSSAFEKCSSLLSVTIGNSVTSIGKDAFCGCDSLTSITIPNSVTSIGEFAFLGCNSLQYNIYDNAKYLGNNENPYLVLVDTINTDITTCTINNNTKIIYCQAFRDCSGLTSITIPNSVTSIGFGVFYDCSGLISITIGNSVTSIGNYAFYGCCRLVEIYNLSSLNIEKGSSDYGYGVGYYVKDIYTSLDEPSKLKTSNGVIYYINGTEKIAVAPEDINVTSIVLDNDCTEINQYLFYNCSNLEKVYYNGTSSEWDKTSIDIYYSDLTSATRYYYSETKPTESGNFWYYDASGNIVEW